MLPTPEIEIARNLPREGCSVEEAERYTRWLATHHYENFSVVSWLLPSDLHQHFYGRAAYDFGEDALIGVAQPLAAGRPDDAIALLKLNLEFYPQSAKTYAAIAFAYTRKYDDPTAITYYEKAVELDPTNGVIRGQLEQLKMYQRKR